MTDSLRKETVKGVAWSSVDRFASGGIQFLANIILARLLSPNDFGLVAVIAIFIQISQVFIDSGFSNALIQKKDRSQTDYSTVFIFNLILSVCFYLLLFLGSPSIAHFFGKQELTSLTRIVGLNLVIGALTSVHKTKLTIELRFKIQAVITLIATVISAVFSIYMAYHGFGVWSLVLLTLINTGIQVILIYACIKWKPTLSFSKKSFYQLFSYSSKLLGASMIHLLYRNIYPIVIGKKFSTTDLGYFNRADTYAMYPSSTISGIISRVAFPIFSRIQDDNERLSKAYSKYIIFSSLLIFPIMTGMIVLAEPLTLLILTESWLPMVPMLQILCIDWMSDHLCQINLNVLYVKGRSDLALRLEVIKKTLAIVIFFISLYWGIIGVCWGRVIYGFFAVYFNSFYTKKMIGISQWQQVKDITIPLVESCFMGLIVWLFLRLETGIYIQVICGILIGIISYPIIIYATQKSYFQEIKQIIINIRIHK